MGICHTCSCRKVSGTVENLLTGAVSARARPDDPALRLGRAQRPQSRPLVSCDESRPNEHEGPQPGGTLTTGRPRAFGRELDALRQRVVADLGQRDVDHIRNHDPARVRYPRSPEAARSSTRPRPGGLARRRGRPPTAKIFENMEIGHNVMHGQYDWTHDPALTRADVRVGQRLPGDDWRHSHNYEHHTFTNMVGKDRDVGYGLLRMTAEQPWHSVLPRQPGLRHRCWRCCSSRGRGPRSRNRAAPRPAAEWLI